MIALHPEEKIILVRRRHPLVLFFEAAPILAAIVGIFSLVLAFRPTAPLLFAAGIFAQALVVALMIVLTDYFLDAWVITNERIIHAELHGLFHRTVTSMAHERVQDTTVVTPGLLASLFRFGDIRVQSAGAESSVLMKQIPDPEGVKQAILDAQRGLRTKA